MRNSIFVTLFLALVVTFSGCNNDDDEGYPDYAAQYLGTWHVTDTQQKLNYDVTITRDGTSTSRIILTNFADLRENTYALVTEQIIIIEEQTINGYTVEGSGTYVNSSKLSIGYTFSDGIDQELRSATFTK